MRHLVSIGHTVTAVAMRTTGAGWTHDGVQVETGRRGRTHVLEFAKNCDVVVSHFGDGGAGAWTARKAEKPSVQMVHGFINRAPSSVDLLVFNSHATQAKDVSVPSVVCHPPTLIEDHRVERTGHKVTLVNLSEDKGVKTAWRAAEILTAHSFLGVHGGYGFQTEPRVPNFETVPTQKDMRRVWERTRILLMPSMHETWGMVGVEAMCSGIPVIAHPTPGLRESLGDAGIFVDREDIDGWVHEIQRLDDPDEYEAASALAKQRVVDLDPQDSLDRFAAALEALT